MSKKNVKIPFSERFMWWIVVIGGVFSALSAIPAVPWRYSRVDTNVGNRYVMERYYTLMGATNNLGKTESWFSFKRKFQRKSEEFGRPSPLTALLGTVTQGMGAGGAAMGCAMWMVCKEHVNGRYISYMSASYAGIACMVMIGVGALCAAATIMFLGFDQDEANKKKKKKKKDDECAEPKTKTMLLNIFAFVLVSGGTTGYTVYTGNMLKSFQRTAYYPYAGAHAGPFLGGLASVLLFLGMFVSIRRVYGGKKDDGDEQAAMMDPYGGGGYGAPPGAYGPPPGAYGAPPGAYGAPPGKGGW